MLTIQLSSKQSAYLVERLSKRQKTVRKHIDELKFHLSHPYISPAMTSELNSVKKRYESELDHIHMITDQIVSALEYEEFRAG